MKSFIYLSLLLMTPHAALCGQDQLFEKGLRQKLTAATVVFPPSDGKGTQPEAPVG
ncbi:MAG TPA: hypothetical protein PLN21_22305 [Gemmatales bacterium]|nr:hypothetical protein [Gemmatales bacterium]